MFTFLSIFSGCEKKDYRRKYTGNWTFNVNIREFNVDSFGYVVFDTICFDGTISFGDEPDEILIQYTERNNIQLKIDENGVLSGFPTHYCGGKFENDNKVHLYLRWGGLGGGIEHKVNGEKQIINRGCK